MRSRPLYLPALYITYKFRLYPTKSQAQLISETLETCRRLYNRLLEQRIHVGVGQYEQKRELTDYRKKDKFLKAVHSQVLQDVVVRLDKAFGSFYSGISGHPKFR